MWMWICLILVGCVILLAIGIAGLYYIGNLLWGHQHDPFELDREPYVAERETIEYPRGVHP